MVIWQKCETFKLYTDFRIRINVRTRLTALPSVDIVHSPFSIDSLSWKPYVM